MSRNFKLRNLLNQGTNVRIPLVSLHTRSLCETLSVRLPEFMAHFAKNTLFLFRPPAPKWKVGQNLALLGFNYPRIPQPPQMKSWSELGTLSFEKLQCECVETNRCIPQGYRLVKKIVKKTYILNQVLEHPLVKITCCRCNVTTELNVWVGGVGCWEGGVVAYKSYTYNLQPLKNLLRCARF